MLTAISKPLKLKGKSQLFKLRLVGSDIEAEAKAPLPLLCRRIMADMPYFAKETIRVVDVHGKEMYRARTVEGWAEKSIVESDRGALHIVNYQPFNGVEDE